MNATFGDKANDALPDDQVLRYTQRIIREYLGEFDGQQPA